MTKAQSFKDLLDEWLGDIKPESQAHHDLYPFVVRVGIVKMAAPRHERFDLIRDSGSGNIGRLFRGNGELSETLTFVFPERHMSVHEQQSMMSVLAKHTEVTHVDIITSSPLLISSFHNTMIRILTWPDDDKHNGKIS
jgi:hypothetical protein